MGTRERRYRERIGRALADVESDEYHPVTPEEALQRFVRLMDTVMPVIQALPHGDPAEDAEPDELDFYRRWRRLEPGRRHS